jgi:hypothetical protein
MVRDALGTAEHRCIREGFHYHARVSWDALSQDATPHNVDVMAHIYVEPLTSAQEIQHG